MTYISPSPSHIDMRSEEETGRKVDLASVGKAVAMRDLPVPGG